MDHLPLPHDPILPAVEVPYLCTERYDTAIPFADYPKSRGKPWMVPDVGQVPYDQHEKMFPTPVSELDSFLQTWLFFGLLAEALGELYNHETFVATSMRDGSLVITTKELEPLVQKRIAWIATLESNTRKQLYEHAGRCISMTWKTLRVDFNARVKHSIAAVAEFLATAVDQAHLTAFPGAGRCQKPFAKGFYTKEIKDRMIEAHWCPSDVIRVKDKFESLHLLHFYSRMKKPAGRANHRDCSETICIAHSISLSEYKTRHCEDCVNEGTCEDISLDSKAIMDVLQTGALPLLQISLKDKVSRKVSVQLRSAAEKGTSYVAISHVWADGMGNSAANSLPMCQLAHLSDIIDNLSEECYRPLIWLDTFCCPVEPEAKKLALSRMRQTYFEAHKVLVLDSNLYCYNSRDLHPAEVNARVLTSPWMRRLWTLQEGALARENYLWIYFKDGPIHMHSLWQRLYIISMLELRYRRLTHDMYIDTRPLSLSNFYESNGAPDLHLLDRALGHRNTTVASDEPLCIATLMNLDINRVLPLSGKLRMHAIWDLLAEKNSGGLPCRMVFLEGPKLEQKGYRWAPASLLPSPERFHNVQTRVARWRSCPQGTITADGLLAEYPGYRLYPLKIIAQRLMDSLPNPWSTLVDLPQIRLIFKDTIRRTWYQLYYKSTSMALQAGQEPSSMTPPSLSAKAAQQNLAFILSAELPEKDGSVPTEDNYREGSTVTITREQQGVLHARLGDGIVLAPLSPHEVMVYEAAECLVQKVCDIQAGSSNVSGPIEPEGEAAVKTLRDDVKSLANHAVTTNPALGDAVVQMIGEGGEPANLWVVVAAWFGSVAEGERITTGQMWCVD